MATDVERLAVLIEANTKSYENAMKKLQQQTDKTLRGMEKRFQQAGGELEAVFGRLGGKLTAAFSVAGVVAGLNQVLSVVKDLAKTGDIAQRIGTTTDFLQALRFEVSQNGGEAGDADNAMQKFADTLGEAAAGGGYLAKVLEANNVALKDKKGNLRSVDDMLQEFAFLVAGAGSAQEKMMLVTEAFGRRAGPQMLLALEEIANKGIAGMTKSAQDAGVIVDKELIKKAQEFDDAWDKATLQASTNIKSFVVKAVDALSQFQSAISATKKELAQLGSAPSTMEGLPGVPPSGGTPDPGAPPQVMTGRIPEFGLSVEGRALARSGKPTIIPSKAPEKGTDVDSFERSVAQAQKRIELLKAETDTIGLGTAARERAKIVAELETAAKNANAAAGMKNTEVTEAQRQKIKEMADAMQSAAQRNYELTQAFQSQQQVMQFAGEQTIDIINAIGGTAEERARALKNVLDQVIQAMLRAALLGEGPLAGFFGTKSSAGGVGGIFGILAKTFGGGFAEGGTMPAGKWGVVGERGPEIITSGARPVSVTPLAAQSGGNHQTIFHMDFRGVNPADRAFIATQVRVAMQQAVPMAVTQSAKTFRDKPSFFTK